MTMTLADRVAIVTGAGNGIGKAIALALARAGAHVVAADIDAGLAKATADAVAGLGRRSLALETDVGDLAAIDAMVRRTTATFERIDVLVNNAGVTRRAGIPTIRRTPPPSRCSCHRPAPATSPASPSTSTAA